MPAQVPHEGASALQFAEFAEDKTETRLNLFIGIEDDGARSAVSEPCRQRKAKLTAGGLLALALMNRI
jgi:hypothetical protein